MNPILAFVIAFGVGLIINGGLGTLWGMVKDIRDHGWHNDRGLDL